MHKIYLIVWNQAVPVCVPYAPVAVLSCSRCPCSCSCCVLYAPGTVPVVFQMSLGLYWLCLRHPCGCSSCVPYALGAVPAVLQELLEIYTHGSVWIISNSSEYGEHVVGLVGVTTLKSLRKEKINLWYLTIKMFCYSICKQHNLYWKIARKHISVVYKP